MFELRQLLASNVPNIIYLSETKLHLYDFDRIRRRYNMSRCFAVDTVGHKGGFAMMCTDECNVDVQSFSLNHVGFLVKMKDVDLIRFMGFYGD